MFIVLRFCFWLAAVCAPAAAFAAFVVFRGGGFDPGRARIMGADLWGEFLLPQLLLSLVPLLPAVIWFALAAAGRASARRPGPAVKALILAPLGIVLAWFVFALIFLGLIYILKSPAILFLSFPEVVLTKNVAAGAALLALGSAAGLYALSAAGRGRPWLRHWAFLAPCILAPAALTAHWLGLHTALPIEGVDSLLRTPEITFSDVSGHVPAMVRKYADYLLWTGEMRLLESPRFYVGLSQLVAVLALGVLPVVLALNVMRRPERPPRVLASLIVLAWIVHLPSDYIQVYSSGWYAWMIGTFDHMVWYGAGSLVRLLAVIGAVVLAVRRPQTGGPPAQDMTSSPEMPAPSARLPDDTPANA